MQKRKSQAPRHCQVKIELDGIRGKTRIFPQTPAETALRDRHQFDLYSHSNRDMLRSPVSWLRSSVCGYVRQNVGELAFRGLDCRGSLFKPNG
jgi:hypothetical protein